MAKAVAESVTPEATPAPTPEAPAQTPAPSFVKPTPATPTKTEVEFAQPFVLPTDAPPAVTGETGEPQPTAKTLTQAEIDSIIAQRIKQVKSQYADYDALKAQVQAFEDAKKTDEQRQADRLSTLEAENARLAQENKATARKAAIIAKASDIGLDADAAIKLADMDTLADDLSNAADVVKAVADKYPALVRQRAAQTAPVNPARSTQPQGRTDADRSKEYFGGIRGGFWNGGGVNMAGNE